MATIYKKKYPVPIPGGATIITRRGKRVARWTSGKGQVRTAPLLDDGRIMFVSDCWYIRYRDADGAMRRRSTGCRDEQAARKVLADILTDVEKVKSGIITSQEKDVASHAAKPLARHLRDYMGHLGRKRLRGRKVSKAYRVNIEGRLTRLFEECKFGRIRDISRETTEKWLDLAEDADLSAATRNEYLTSLSAFCNWAVKTGRLASNPVTGIGKADASSDRRRVRRALTVDEVARLLDAARRRPIAELGRRHVPLPEEDQCGRSTWTYEPLTAENFDRCYEAGLKYLAENPERKPQLEQLGRERALFYLLAVSTGLRRKELMSLTIGQVHTNAVPAPFIELLAKDTKSCSAATIPLRPDVIDELQACMDAQGDDLPADAKLFPRPPRIRVFDADCQAAGIAKTDARGRQVDIHALRHTFGTHLSAVGVRPRTAMAAMRHSRIELTMNYYTDPVLLDVAGAVGALPDFARGHKADTSSTAVGA